MSTERRTALPNASFLFGIVVFCLFAALATLWLRMIPRTESYDQKRVALRQEKLRTLRVEDEKRLNSYAWVDQKKGVVRIPVERAMEVVAAELAQKPVHPSEVKVENPYPAGLQQQPAPAASPVPEVKK